MAKKTGKIQRDPVAYHVLITVDAHGKFTYKLPDGSDASTLRPINNDTVDWSLKVRGKQQPFTIEFPNYGPFGIRNRVARSFGGRTVPLTVNISPLYRGNLVMKYNVTLTNGWSDDPDIVPVPSDGIVITSVTNPLIVLSVTPTGVLITPKGDIYAGEVTWKWDDTVHGSHRDDFDLTFDATIPGWPQTASSNGTQQIVLNLPKGGPAGYTLTTVNLGLDGKSTLTVV